MHSIITWHNEKETTTTNECSSTVRKKFKISIFKFRNLEKEKFSEIFVNFFLCFRFAISHSYVFCLRWTFMVWQRTKPFKNSFCLHKKNLQFGRKTQLSRGGGRRWERWNVAALLTINDFETLSTTMLINEPESRGRRNVLVLLHFLSCC